ncbi:hypothetical protein [uncultured Corynebacterium sp.]|uniref:hypothetical protein n=1 Tax=uncultured Corynebacterium sp. TaxID=159447 RepID=UPI0025CD9409|nr:hypothetical protein [uncultured Corynebacterium sp.]
MASNPDVTPSKGMSVASAIGVFMAVVVLGAVTYLFALDRSFTDPEPTEEDVAVAERFESAGNAAFPDLTWNARTGNGRRATIGAQVSGTIDDEGEMRRLGEFLHEASGGPGEEGTILRRDDGDLVERDGAAPRERIAARASLRPVGSRVHHQGRRRDSLRDENGEAIVVGLADAARPGYRRGDLRHRAAGWLAGASARRREWTRRPRLDDDRPRRRWA